MGVQTSMPEKKQTNIKSIWYSGRKTAPRNPAWCVLAKHSYPLNSKTFCWPVFFIRVCLHCGNRKLFWFALCRISKLYTSWKHAGMTITKCIPHPCAHEPRITRFVTRIHSKRDQNSENVLVAHFPDFRPGLRPQKNTRPGGVLPSAFGVASCVILGHFCKRHVCSASQDRRLGTGTTSQCWLTRFSKGTRDKRARHVTSPNQSTCPLASTSASCWTWWVALSGTSHALFSGAEALLIFAMVKNWGLGDYPSSWHDGPCSHVLFELLSGYHRSDSFPIQCFWIETNNHRSHLVLQDERSETLSAYLWLDVVSLLAVFARVHKPASQIHGTSCKRVWTASEGGAMKSKHSSMFCMVLVM